MKRKNEIAGFLATFGFKPFRESEDGKECTVFTNGSLIFPTEGKSLKDVMDEMDLLLKDDLVRKKGDYIKEENPEEELPMNGEEEDVFKDNSEDVTATFIAEDLKEVWTPVFRRLTLDGNRYYYRRMEDNSIKIYASGTNLIKDGYAEEKSALNEWKAMMKNLGINPVEAAEYEADKGTIMHYLYGLYLMGRDIYLRRSFIINAVAESDLKISKKNMARFSSSIEDLDDMINRIVRFARFCADYKVRPLLIEKILCLDEYEVASPIDAVVEMSTEETEEGYFGETYLRDTKDHKKGDPKLSKRKYEKKFHAILDFKSGYIYPSHSLQLHLYRLMVNKWYGDVLKIEKIYNFSPKSESSKGYTLRDQTNNKEIRKADAVFTQGMINHQNKEKVYKAYEGKLNINEPFTDSKYLVVYDIAEELSKRT